MGVEESLDNIRALVDPTKIDYVVANHAEPDHSGGLPAIIRLTSQVTVLVSRIGMESIPEHHYEPWSFGSVRTSDRISLGRHKLIVVEAPNAAHGPPSTRHAWALVRSSEGQPERLLEWPERHHVGNLAQPLQQIR